MPDFVRLINEYAKAAPGANVNIVAPVSPTRQASALRVGVCLTTASVFNMYVDNGTTAYTQGLLSSVALNAGDFYALGPIPCREGCTYAFRVETDSVIQTLIVDEVFGSDL